MEPSAMNDDFLRRLRPVPRAAFVHELKRSLDRLPREQSIARGPAYLRTLLIALLIGGAAFAVTMMATRRDPVGARTSGPVLQTARPSDSEAGVVTAVPSASSTGGDQMPVIPHVAGGDLGSSSVEAAVARQETPQSTSGAPSVAPGVAQVSAPPLVAGIAIAGEGINSIRGMGSEFPTEIYRAWSSQYYRQTGVSVAYDDTGYGGGLRLLATRAANFATTDFAVDEHDLKASGLFQFPMLAGGVVPVVHLAGVKPSQITLDAATLARIYLGEIVYWNDAPIRELNPGLALPATRITLAYRTDSSPSTTLFTGYLAGASPAFQRRYGVRAKIDVSPGSAVVGDRGMADLLASTDGAIGYLAYRYARLNKIESIRLINKAGRVVPATPESLQSAVTHADWWPTPGLGAPLLDLRGDQTWPLSSASFVVVPGPSNRAQTAAVLQFFDWAYRNGSQGAAQLGYVPIPPVVANRVRDAWIAELARGTPPPDPGRQ